MEYSDLNKKKTAYIIIGLLFAFISNRVMMFTSTWLWYYVGLVLLIASVLLILYACYLWTKVKNRHRLFMLWGLLAPIGLLGISLLKDKS